MTHLKPGTVYGVGVGPGDPKLITLRAAEVLGTVRVVVAPGTGEVESGLALDLARPHLSPECRVMAARLPMTADRNELQKAWEKTARVLMGEAFAGQDVAFVTLGDPTLYSTWGYVVSVLRSIAPKVPIDTVPGVMSMAACAAYSGVSLAQGREPLLIWPAAPNEDLRAWSKAFPNVVLMKAGPHLESIAELAEFSDHEAIAVRRVGQSKAATTGELRSWSDSSEYFTTVIMKRRATTAEKRMRPERGEE